MWCTQFITYIIPAAAYGPWHLGLLFHHDTQYSQRGWYITNLILCDIPRNKAQRTGLRHIWRTVPFLWPRQEQTAEQWVNSAGQCLLWLLLLRLPDVVPLLLLLLLPQNNLLTSPFFATNSGSMFATRISLFCYLFYRPLLDTQIVCLV